MPLNRSLVGAEIKSKSVEAVTFLDLDKSALLYHPEITQHRRVSSCSGDEEIVRAYLITRLVNDLHYPMNRIAIERTYDVGRPKVNKPRIDVIVYDEHGDIFLYIETKAPDEFDSCQEEVIEKQLFNLASLERGEGRHVKYLALYSIETTSKVDELCLVIDYDKHENFESWNSLQEGTDQLPANYERSRKDPYVKGGAKDLDREFSQEQLTALQTNLHNVLWGGGGTDDNEIFSSLTNLILAKIQDESEKSSDQVYDFQFLAYDSGAAIEFESDESLFERINTLYRRALHQRLNIESRVKLQRSYVVDENKFSHSKLKFAIRSLERYSFVDGKNSFTGKDILGDFFEGIIRSGFKQTKGQFFTHINIVRAMLWGMQLDRLAIERVNTGGELPYVVDPSAGSGTFLIEYMKFLTPCLKYRFRSSLNDSRDLEDKFANWFEPANRENKWAKDYIYGCEINFNLGTAAKVNMILHGDGATNIFVQDGLLSFEKYHKSAAPNALNNAHPDPNYQEKMVNANFDVVITNPPFSVNLDSETKRTLTSDFVFSGKKNSENLFIERWYQLLKPNGRVAAVLPESVFDTSDNKYIRMFLLKYFKVKAVLSLPELAFEPYTSTKTSVLFAQKKTADELATWSDRWACHSKRWSYLKTRCKKELQHIIGGEKLSNAWAIAKESENTRRENVIELLSDSCVPEDLHLSLNDLVKKYRDDLAELCKYDQDTETLCGYVNTWWVLTKVSKDINYDVCMLDISQVGYKRSLRGVKEMPNDLFDTDEDGQIIVDPSLSEKAIISLRNIKWD